MSSPAWYKYLRPHRFPEVPAVFRLALAALSGAILSRSFHGSFPSIYSWFCIAILLASILGARALVAFFCGYVHGLAFVFTSVPWIAKTLSVHGGMSLAAGWGVLLVIALIWGAATGVYGWIVQRLSLRSYTLALIGAPFLWISTEVFRTYLPEISFPWALLGYAPAENPALVQLATVTGVYGLSFLAAAFNSLLLWIDCGPATDRKRRTVVFCSAVFVLLLIMTIGPHFVPHPPAYHRARVVQPNFPENMEYEGDWYGSHKSDLVQLEDLSLRPSPSNPQPDLLIWPEAPAPFSFEDAHFVPYITNVAKEFHKPVIVGVIEWKLGSAFVNGVARTILLPYNSAVMLNGSGQRVFSYDKIHLVPFGEYEPFPLIHQVVSSVSGEVGGFRKGTQRSVGMLANGNRFSVFICYEAIYPDEVRQFTNRGAQLLINVSNDGWFGTSAAAEQHLRMARVRAVENRRWLVRDTNSGLTASIDPYGNMTRILHHDVRGAGDLPYDFRTERTFYVRFGDWFSWLCVTVSVILFMMTFRKVKPAC
jgi:apolipoprotein N-acyltransferase